MKPNARPEILTAVIARALIFVSVFYLLHPMFDPLTDGHFGFVHPWMIACFVCAVFGLNSLVLRHSVRLMIITFCDLLAAASAFLIFSKMLPEETGVLLLASVGGIAFAGFSDLYLRTHFVNEGVFQRQFLLLIFLTVGSVLLESETSFTNPWRTELIAACAIPLLGSALLHRVSLRNLFLGAVSLGFSGLLAASLGKPAAGLILRLTDLLKDFFGTFLRFLLRIFSGHGPRAEVSAGGSVSQGPEFEKMAESSGGGEIFGYIVFGLFLLMMALGVLILLVTFLRWFLSKRLAVTPTAFVRGGGFRMKTLLAMVRDVARDLRAYLLLRKKKGSVAAILVELERKNMHHRELSRKPWETPEEFIRKTGFGGELFIAFVNENLYGKEKNLLATWKE